MSKDPSEISERLFLLPSRRRDEDQGRFREISVPVKEYSNPGELIALRHAMKNYLGRDSGLAGVIRAVVDGNLVPVGYTNRFRGITGYLFLSEDLRKYRRFRDGKMLSEDFLNYREAAATLGVKAPVIRGMVKQGILSTLAGYRPGLSKLVPAGEIRRFSEHYVSVRAFAKHLNLRSGLLARYLRNLGTPVLAVSIAEEGRPPALFVLKDIAANVEIPLLGTVTV